MLSSLIGTSTYVYSSNYDAAGRVKLRILGSSSGLRTQYGYYDWSSQGGRLSTIQSGTNQMPTSIQDLIYQYDQAGNVNTITDTLAGPQIQHFSYDELSRLTMADATGGISGTYQEAYTYDLTTGNLASKAGVGYEYDDAAHAHAVTKLGGVPKFAYDLNGNMISRNTSESYTLSYDAENRMTQASWQSGAKNAQFLYDGDGNRVRGQVITDTTIYIGSYYEWGGTTATKYYYDGASRIAMRKGNDLRYIFTDHLGSTSKITDVNGQVISETRYKAWGEERYTSGSSQTTFGYTGQRQEEGLELYFYNARWYDSLIGRWIQPDTIIPEIQNSQSYDRYTYTQNNPIRFIDPSGHMDCENDGYCPNDNYKPPSVVINPTPKLPPRYTFSPDYIATSFAPTPTPPTIIGPQKPRRIGKHEPLGKLVKVINVNGTTSPNPFTYKGAVVYPNGDIFDSYFKKASLDYSVSAKIFIFEDGTIIRLM